MQIICYLLYFWPPIPAECIHSFFPIKGLDLIWLATSAALRLRLQKTQNNMFSPLSSTAFLLFLLSLIHPSIHPVFAEVSGWRWSPPLCKRFWQSNLVKAGDSLQPNGVNRISMQQDVGETAVRGPWDPIMTRTLCQETCCSRFVPRHPGAKMITGKPSAHTRSWQGLCWCAAHSLSLPKLCTLKAPCLI